MSRSTRIATLVAAVLASGAALLAQQPIHPNTDRGFKPETVFQVGDIDNINLFNGQLNLSIPIGPSLPMGGGRSYSLTLAYSSRVWDYRTAPNCPDEPLDSANVVQAFPSLSSNAGLGWLLSLGRLVQPDQADYHYYNPEPRPLEESLYEGPDGSRHFFYAKLHDGNDAYPANLEADPAEGPIASVGYSRDGSFIRRKTYASGRVDVDTPDGLTRRFDLAGELVRIFDSFDNFIAVSNFHQVPTDPASPLERIEIRDKYGRLTTIHFRSNVSDFKNYTRLVDKVVFPAFRPGNTATYQFNYADVEFGRGYTPSVYACTAPLNVPTLHSIDLPSSSDPAFYEFAYNRNEGTMSRALLPTGGSVWWVYQDYLLPSEGCTEAKWFDVQRGVKSRTLKDEGGVVIGTWTYDQEMGPMFQAPNEPKWKCSASTRQWDTGQPPHESRKELFPWIMRSITAPGQEHGAPGATGTKTEHFFSTWKDRDPHPNGAQAWEYGLPFARISDTPAAPPYVATKQYASATGPLVTSSFVEYERDESPFIQDVDGNRRVKQEFTVFDADGGRYVWKTHLSSDGFGHYRMTIAGGTLGSSESITSYTAVNEDSLGRQTGADGERSGTFAFAVTDRWLPSLFTEKMVETSWTGGGDANRTLFCFDRSTGFLAGKRTILQTTKSGDSVSMLPVDTVVRYERDAEGNVATERYFGGDRNQIGYAGCEEPGGIPTYTLEHTYSRGSLATSKYAGFSFFTVDNTLDHNTGLVSATRDSAGVEADLAYDERGRLSSASAPGSGVTTYSYRASPASGGPSVEVTTRSASNSALLSRQLYRYDGLGRLRESREFAPTTSNGNGEWVTRAVEYNALGAKTRVYEPIAESQGAQSTAYTSFSGFDSFGRPGAVTQPDGKATTFTYFGRRRVDRTVSVQTQSGPTSSTTTENYDNFGRLSQVIEPAGLNGASVTTEYNYDAGGRLTKVCANKIVPTCGQERWFIFDGAGFLREERHPESGSTFYNLYDVRGHVGEKSKPDASLFDLQFTYDGAERPTVIKARNPYYTDQFRELKRFRYGTTNHDGTLERGKLVEAARHAYLPFLGDMLVTEEYTYGDAAGRRTERLTIVENLSSFDLLQILRQSVEYDELGNVVRADYPECAWEDCGTSTRKFTRVENRYTLGRLTAIDSYAAQMLPVISSVKYHANGMPAEIIHGNGIKETIALDPSGMARPGRYSFGMYGTCATPLILAQPQGSTIPQGGSVTLAVSAQAQEGQLRYQWMSTHGPIANAIQPVFTTPPLTQNERYWVNVRSWCGETTSLGAEIGLGATQSAVAEIQVAACSGPPTITSQPAGTTIPNGQSATLTVTAGGTGPFIYQWFQGLAGDVSTPVGNGTSALSLTSMTTTRTYWVRISNDCGAVNSIVATVTVLACATAPGIATQPQSATVFYNQSATLTVTASGTGPFTYQWYLGPAGTTTNLVGTDSSSYTTPVLVATTQHWVRVSNACGGTNSQTATITVLACSGPPSIAMQPANQSVTSGQTATLGVTAGGTGPFSYQWYQGASGTTTTPVGTNAATYTTPSLSSTTQYWVRVSNACGPTNSQAATITVASYATPVRRQMLYGVTSSNNKTGQSFAATQQGSLLLAFVATGSTVAVTPPTGWQLVASQTGKPRLSIYAIENAAPRSGFQQFDFSGYTAATIVLAEYTGIAISTALDQMATASGTSTNASSGTTPMTTQPKELVLTFLGTYTSPFGPATNGFTEVKELMSMSVVHEKVVSSAGTYGHSCAISGSLAWRGIVLTYRALQQP